MTAFDRFRAAMLARDPATAVAEMAEDVRFYNPASPEPTIGREAALATFQTLIRVFDEFEHVHVLDERTGDPRSCRMHAIHFRARVGDQELEGVDLVEVEDDEIVSFRVVVRPASALAAIAQVAARAHAGVDGRSADSTAG